jgi:arylsulfatase A-like enzyme
MFRPEHPKGRRVKKIVHIADIMSTILKAAKINTSSHEMDGKILLRIIKGKEKKREVL